MRILIAAGIYPPDAGGPAVHAEAQFRGFPKLGVETGLVALSHYRNWPKGISHLLYFAELLSQASKYDVIYGHDAVGAGIPALIAARIFGKKFVARIGGDIAWEYQSEQSNLSLKEWYASGEHLNDKMFILSRWLMNRADLVMLPSSMLVDLYTNYYGIDAGKIKLILNPIPETPAKTNSTEKTIIWASRLTTYKNLPIVLRALAKVFPEHKDLRFIIMGDGPEKNHLQELSKELNIESNIVFADRSTQTEVMEKTSSCLFVIAPALTEFNPNYVLQGVGFGKPFLISREHGLPFEVPEYLLFNPRDESEIYGRIISLLGEDNYRRAQQFVRSIDLKVRWEDNLKANIELINALLKV